MGLLCHRPQRAWGGIWMDLNRAREYQHLAAGHRGEGETCGFGTLVVRMSLLSKLFSIFLSPRKPARSGGRPAARSLAPPTGSVVTSKPTQSTDFSSRCASELISHQVGSYERHTSGSTIPSAPPRSANSRIRWVSHGESVEIHGVTIPRGMVYVGVDTGANEPGLIDPKLPVDSRSLGPGQALPYWPSYSIMSPATRYRYLRWLAAGAKDRDVELGYAFVYFYGLERRLLLEADAAEREVLLAEVDRLLRIFGSNGSFWGYARRLTEFVELRGQLSSPTDDLPTFGLSSNYELPPALRFGLGRFARDQRPLPLPWALSWALSDPFISRRTPVSRCPDPFARAFAKVYEDANGSGMILPHNKTALKLTYNPASAGLRGYNFQLDCGNVPDILAVTGPQKKLQALVEEATCLINPYSRFLGRHADQAETLEAYLTLPPALWPDSIQQNILALRETVVSTMEPLTYGEVLNRLGGTANPAPNAILDLARVLQEDRIGVEPDVLAGVKKPMPSDVMVLFPLASQVNGDRATEEYRTASLTVALSASLALADGEASDAELISVEKRISTWDHLDENLQTRLRAQYRLQVRQPASLSALKTKVGTLTPGQRLELGMALACLAKADGVVSAEEVKLLERMYRTLQLDPQLVYSHLHQDGDQQSRTAADGDEISMRNRKVPTLNADRIARLQHETATVSALLATVFVEEDIPVAVSSEHSAIVDASAHEESESAAVPSPLPGLDREHTAFLVLLLSRPVWSREELVAAATDMQVMLDGALERINDAALDTFGSLLVEGDDPVYVETELLEATAI
jgi:tellurite resistance protein